MTSPAPQLYDCRVMHRRRFPLRYRFDYRVFSLLLDLDAVDAVCARIPFFSRNRFNLVAFYDRDHGPRDGSSLRTWLNTLLQSHGIDECDNVRLLSMPRVLGYVFNPLSVYYCLDADQAVRAVVCEVKNTFGEQHCYVLHNNNQALTYPVTMQSQKVFHVSPFMAIEGDYAFRFSAPGSALSVCIKHVTSDGTQLVAVQRGEAQALTALHLFKAVARTPFMTFKVVAMIHWRALRIWLTRTPLHHKPPPPIEESSQ